MQAAILDLAGTTMADDGLVLDAVRAGLRAARIRLDGPRYPALDRQARATMDRCTLTVFGELLDGDMHRARRAEDAFVLHLADAAAGGRVREVEGAGGTRPGPDAAMAAEEGIAGLVRAGADPATALHTIVAIAHFVTGFVLEEQAAAQRSITDAGPGEDLPLLHAALATGGAPEGDRSFEHGLAALIDGLARRLPGPAEGERP